MVTARTVHVTEADVPLQRRFFRRVKSLVLRSELLYGAFLQWKFGAARLSQPPGPALANGTLKSVAEWHGGEARISDSPLGGARVSIAW